MCLIFNLNDFIKKKKKEYNKVFELLKLPVVIS